MWVFELIIFPNKNDKWQLIDFDYIMREMSINLQRKSLKFNQTCQVLDIEKQTKQCCEASHGYLFSKLSHSIKDDCYIAQITINYNKIEQCFIKTSKSRCDIMCLLILTKQCEYGCCGDESQIHGSKEYVMLSVSL